MPARRLERLAGEVLPVLRERLLGLVLQLVGARLQLLGLELDALSRRSDVGDALSYLLELLELLFVGEVEGLAWVFDPVEHLVRLRLYYARQALHEGHATVPSWDIIRFYAITEVLARAGKDAGSTSEHTSSPGLGRFGPSGASIGRHSLRWPSGRIASWACPNGFVS